MSLLTRNAKSPPAIGGGFVQSIDGARRRPATARSRSTGSTTSTASRRRTGAAARDVHPGDHIWWDRHDWSQTDDVPAVVGSFPEPFLNGLDGKRLPVRVECAEVGGAACDGRPGRLRDAGVPAGVAALGGGARARRRCACSSAPWASSRGDPRRASSSRARARAASTRASPAAGARSRCSTQRRARGADAAGRRGPDRGHAHRRRRADLGRHRHRRRRCGRRGAAPLRRASLRNRFARRRRAAAAAPLRACRGRWRDEASTGPFFYRRLASPLHAARAGVGALWLARADRRRAAALPPAGAARAAARACSAPAPAAGSARELSRALRTAAIVAVPIVLVNVLVAARG